MKKLSLNFLIILASFTNECICDACTHFANGEAITCEFGCCGSDLDLQCCQHRGHVAYMVIGAVLFACMVLLVVGVCYKKKTKSNRTIGPVDDWQTDSTRIRSGSIDIVNYLHVHWIYGIPLASANRMNSANSASLSSLVTSGRERTYTSQPLPEVQQNGDTLLPVNKYKKPCPSTEPPPYMSTAESPPSTEPPPYMSTAESPPSYREHI